MLSVFLFFFHVYLLSAMVNKDVFVRKIDSHDDPNSFSSSQMTIVFSRCFFRMSCA